MKILFTFFFLVYIVLNSYIAVRSWQALQSLRKVQIFVLILIITFSLCFIFTLLFDSHLPFRVASVVHLIGTTWFTAMIYFVIVLLLFDVVKLTNNFFDFLPKTGTVNYQNIKIISFFSSIVFVVLILSIAYYNFNNVKIKNLEINLTNSESAREINITAVSDLHIGFSVKKNRLKKYIDLINSQNPDVVFLVGDIVDKGLKPVLDQNMFEDLSKLKSKCGIYAVAGNHEMLGNLHVTKKYLESIGINMLLDTSVLLDEKIWIVGRKDKTDKTRLKIDDLMKSIDKKYPVILLDHQPYDLSESQKAGVKLHLSGHTHAGQIFPNNLIVSSIYELPHGYLKKGDTHYYVSSGLGLWGAPFRLCSNSEIVNIKLKY